MEQYLCIVVHDITLSIICLKIRDIWDIKVCKIAALPTLIPPDIMTYARRLISCFVNSLSDTWVWNASLNDQFTRRSGYNWPLSQHHTENPHRSWSWIWKLRLVQFFVWKTCHKYLHTRSIMPLESTGDNNLAVVKGRRNHLSLSYGMFSSF